MSKYEVSFRKLIVQMLPLRLRGTLVYFIEVLIRPLKSLYYKFMLFKSNNEDALSYNSQMPLLQKLLNNYLKTSDVYVEDATYIEIDGVYENLEYKPKKIGFWGVISKDEIGYNGFVVYVPVSFRSRENAIKSLVDKYKFSGTNYSIVYFN